MKMPVNQGKHFSLHTLRSLENVIHFVKWMPHSQTALHFFIVTVVAKECLHIQKKTTTNQHIYDLTLKKSLIFTISREFFKDLFEENEIIPF